MSRVIHVTQPSLAPLSDFIPYLEQIWQSGIMTHNGPLLQRLEKELARVLDVPDVICVSNGTSAMQIAIRALDLDGEIITTPFSFVATSGIALWERCKPVFVDIDPDTWNIDVELIERAITPKTVGILPVHVFSAPCKTTRIKEIAEQNNLRVIYDAAHAMAVRHDGKSILLQGDVSCLSFHATKLFNTGEGGACVTQDDVLARRLRRMRFFGFDEGKTISDLGMNAKMTEVSAALGLANLPHLAQVQRDRRRKYLRYLQLLADCPCVRFQKIDPEEYNYSYMPILFDSEERLLRADSLLKKDSVFARRYFHPSLSEVAVFKCPDILPVVRRVSRAVLCLPLHGGVSLDDISFICERIRWSACE